MKNSRDYKSAGPSGSGCNDITRYTVALGVMISFGPPPVLPPNKRKAMFLAGPLLTGDDWETFADLAEERDHDIVCLEFGAKVAGGPHNISVYEHSGNAILHWGDCSLWMREDGEPAVILPKGCNFAFGYEGQHLVRLGGFPTSNLAEGFAKAKDELQRAFNRVTPAMLQYMTKRQM